MLHHRSSRRLRSRTPILLVLCLALLAAQCAKNPVTGKREFMLMSESQEIQLGAESDPSIVAQYGLVDDESLAAYVDSLGQEMVKVCHRPNLKFTFRLLDDPIVNAFALPGGYVYITRGIMAYLSDEAALAGVMGHEIGHVTARHGAQRYTEQQLYGLGLGLGSVFSQTFAQYADLAGQAVGLLLLKYGRDDERQADRLGVEYATKIGYDTREMAYFFHTLDRMTAAAGGSGLPTWQSTHPDPGERYQTVLGLTGEWQAQLGSADYRENRASYLRRIEGLVFGQNPRHGYVADGAFLHPDLEFRFPIPDGWQVLNTPSQVQIIAPDQQSAILFMVESGVETPRQAADQFVAKYGAQIESRNSLSVHGYPAERMVSLVQQQGGYLRVHSTWVEKDELVYVFLGLGAQAGAVTATSNGFARLTDPEALAIQPVVLHITPAPRSGTFEELAADFPIPEGSELDVAGLALLNGLELTDRVEQGTRIKVLRSRADDARPSY